MKTEARVVPAPVEATPVERGPLRNGMRPGRGVLVGLALSAIVWLGLLVLWLSI